MVKVLFVCLGNICRSPMAEAIFRKIVKDKGLEQQIEVDSAGTGNWHEGKPPHEGTLRILTDNQIDVTGLTARQVIEEDLNQFDYIIGMDAENVGNLRRMAGHHRDVRIERLLDYVPHLSVENVPDPYYTGDFDEVYGLVTAGCKQLVEEIIKEQKLS
ncbi:low molecular weight phosphotyrosine protein phosphatase [Priestia flexa]|uniref:low molecular weight protein-tyrosine-phosphatase n=1 Tax=Priestia flexa TaxID=86664 RepID=UPI001CFD3CA1|nr:low molecular weight protein-tyrosine-phosphatase [Priestia flexa]UIR30333.1 low molecular weight phosphotyrosine protein phosphatase [Priestia flexa]